MKGHYDRPTVARINWALDLGQTDIGQLRDGDVLNLYDEGREFMGKNIGEETAGAFQRAVRGAVVVQTKTMNLTQKRAYVEALAEGFALIVDVRKNKKGFQYEKGDGYQMLITAFAGEPFRLVVEPDLLSHRAAVRLAEFIHSQKFLSDQIRPCSECGHLFAIAMRLRKDVKNYYHSEKCRQRAVARKRVR